MEKDDESTDESKAANQTGQASEIQDDSNISISKVDQEIADEYGFTLQQAKEMGLFL